MAYSLDNDQIQDLRDAIDILEAASRTPARSRATKISPTVDEICEHAYQFGLQAEELERIVQLVTTRTALDQSSVTTLIKNLYPASHVKNDVVILVINCIGQGKRNPSASTQVALVRWLAAVHDVLEDQASVSRFYAVLFNLLDMISTRPVLCQLLSIITRRKHVRPFRIQRLLELSQQTANEPALANLLRVYKNFCPEIVIGTTVSKIPQSLLPDSEWRQRLLLIQQTTASLTGDLPNVRGFRVARNSTRNGRKPTIPEVHTFHAGEKKRTLEEIQNVSEFVEHLEMIEIPSQVVSALRDPLLQRYLQLGGSAETERRLQFWLTQYFEEELEGIKEGFGLSATLPEMFAGVVSYTESSKTLLHVVEQFLQVYMPLWNGSSDLGAILDLMSYLPPQPFSELQQNILSTLERSILGGAERPFETLFEFYANLIQRWMDSKGSTATGRTPRGFLKSNALFDIIQHVSIVAESAVAAGQPVQAAILDFYERLADLITEQISQRKQILPPILPPQPLLYSLAATSSLSQFSRLCALLVTYKRCFEKQEAGVTRVYQANATDLLNGYLMDICNMIWRSRALNTTDPNATGLLCPNEVTGSLQSYLTKVERDYSVHTMFDFSHNAMTAALAQSALSALEEDAHHVSDDDMPLHAGPVTQRSLMILEKEGGLVLSWKHYRLEVLDWLENHKLDGMKKLMFATMKDLMK